jgi:kinesin family protein 6/9
VVALSEKARDHIPYRQNKLTNLLKDSIGGNSKTIMIANIWPEALHLEETISTLKFASRMMKVQNEATIQLKLDPDVLLKKYEREIKDLK